MKLGTDMEKLGVPIVVGCKMSIDQIKAFQRSPSEIVSVVKKTVAPPVKPVTVIPPPSVVVPAEQSIQEITDMIMKLSAKTGNAFLHEGICNLVIEFLEQQEADAM